MKVTRENWLEDHHQTIQEGMAQGDSKRPTNTLIRVGLHLSKPSQKALNIATALYNFQLKMPMSSKVNRLQPV